MFYEKRVFLNLNITEQKCEIYDR